ncbi:hypothetical protein TYRP_014935 [Tyrophagus putrescentiae]|nr:hypothetical protein TYRP_014935 [Tyrophagus putrescentiae]
MSENPSHNCALIVSALREHARKQTAELEKNRVELAKIEKETMELIKKELAMLQNKVDMMKLSIGGGGPGPGPGDRSSAVAEKSNPPPPPPNSPVAKRHQNEVFRDINDDDDVPD